MFDYKLKVLLLFAQIYVAIVSFSIPCKAQNLLANGSFEESNICSEYQVPCAPEAWFRYPPVDLDIYLKNVDLIHEGKKSEVVIIEDFNFPVTLRLHLYSMLLCPLEAGEEYTLSMYLNPIHDRNYALDVLFTSEEIVEKHVNPLELKPAITITNEGKYERANKWRYKEAQFIATGNERFINFGNFSPDPYVIKEEYIAKKVGYQLVYLIDNVELKKSNGNHTHTCDLELRKSHLYDVEHRHTYKKMELPKEPKKDSTYQTNHSSKEISLTVPDFAFNFNQSEIKKEYYHTLDSLINILENQDVETIKVTGHTDNIGELAYNQSLSEKRARAVHNYLSKYINTEYKIRGKGETAPLFLNTSESNRERNRRVEIEIVLRDN